MAIKVPYCGSDLLINSSTERYKIHPCQRASKQTFVTNSCDGARHTVDLITIYTEIYSRKDRKCIQQVLCQGCRYSDMAAT
jgi:hypothetical protein